MQSVDYGDVALGVECAWPVPGVQLAHGALVPMRDAAGTTVSVHTGVVWITEENGERDVVLRAGDSFRFHGSGLALVEAWTDAALTFSAAD
ncbi:MAG: DUF2917 domain-containing protein [Betaproteobacteria bacterium]|nr:DUF2917 domain-containing protein [Betaproteobacteria bacterium]